MDIKTVILLGNFFHFFCAMLLSCQQRFLFNVFYVFYFFHKKRVFNGFLFLGSTFFTSMVLMDWWMDSSMDRYRRMDGVIGSVDGRINGCINARVALWINEQTWDKIWWKEIDWRFWYVLWCWPYVRFDRFREGKWLPRWKDRERDSCVLYSERIADLWTDKTTYFRYKKAFSDIKSLSQGGPAP